MLRRALLALPLAACALLALGAGVARAAGVGEKAPPLTPDKWWNNKGPVSWQALDGRVKLIEKWATW